MVICVDDNMSDFTCAAVVSSEYFSVNYYCAAYSCSECYVDEVVYLFGVSGGHFGDGGSVCVIFDGDCVFFVGVVFSDLVADIIFCSFGEVRCHSYCFVFTIFIGLYDTRHTDTDSFKIGK